VASAVVAVRGCRLWRWGVDKKQGEERRSVTRVCFGEKVARVEKGGEGGLRRRLCGLWERRKEGDPELRR
jgi:hypothetical protein